MLDERTPEPVKTLENVGEVRSDDCNGFLGSLAGLALHVVQSGLQVLETGQHTAENNYLKEGRKCLI